MTLDSLLTDLGGFGRFQLLLQFTLSYNTLCVSWSMLQMSFAGFIPDWYCNTVDAGYQGDAMPMGYNGTKEACQVNNSWTLYEKTDCHHFQFQSSAVTVVTEWDLVCDQKWIKSAVTSIQMGGVLLGAFVCGQLADRIGRKKTMYGSVLYHSVVNIITAFSVSWEMFAVCRFFIGIGIGAVLVVQLVYPIEFMPIKWRPVRVLLPVWVIGVCIFAGFAVLLDNWSHLHLACGLFGLPGLIGYIYLPESMRWLVVQGRLKEAEVVCKKIASINRKEMPSNAKSVLEKIYHEEQEIRQSSGKYSYVDILKEWSSLKVTLTFSFFWFSLSIIYYGISFGVSALAGSLYLNIFLLAAVEVPSQLLSFFLMNIIGRKKTVLLFIGIGFFGAIGCIIAEYAAPSDSKGQIITGLSLITKMGIGSGWGVISYWGLELYPTVTRNLGFGFANTAARIGGIIAPFVIDFDDRIAVSYAIIGVLNFVSILLCFVNPDTKGRILEDTLAKKDNSVQEMGSANKQANEKKAAVFTLKVDPSDGLKNTNSGWADDKFVNVRL